LEACRGYCALRIGYQPSNLEHSAGRITRPLRGSGVRYQGINVAMLWSAAIAKGYAALFKWMFRARECHRGFGGAPLLQFARLRSESNAAAVSSVKPSTSMWVSFPFRLRMRPSTTTVSTFVGVADSTRRWAGSLIRPLPASPQFAILRDNSKYA